MGNESELKNKYTLWHAHGRFNKFLPQEESGGWRYFDSVSFFSINEFFDAVKYDGGEDLG